MGYSPQGCKRVGQDLATEQQQLDGQVCSPEPLYQMARGTKECLVPKCICLENPSHGRGFLQQLYLKKYAVGCNDLGCPVAGQHLP